jgi:hypothetical protein
MKTICLIENNIIIDALIFDDMESAQEAFPDTELIDLTVNPRNIGIGWYRENGIWYSQKPSENHTVWSEEFILWMTPEEYQDYLDNIASQE